MRLNINADYLGARELELDELWRSEVTIDPGYIIPVTLPNIDSPRVLAVICDYGQIDVVCTGNVVQLTNNGDVTQVVVVIAGE
jgi:hypothetical protein